MAQVTEERIVREDVRPGPATIAARIVNGLGAALIAFLAVRFIFQLLGANQSNQIVNTIYAWSEPFVRPFNGIFGEPTYGQSQFESASLVAIIAYGLLTFAVQSLLLVGSRNQKI